MTRRGFFRMLVVAPVAAAVARMAPKPAPMAFHPGAFEFVMAPVDLGEGWVRQGLPGISMRFVRSWDVTPDPHPTRMDWAIQAPEGPDDAL